MTKWVFEVPANYLNDKAKNKLEISGTDLHNNLLQKKRTYNSHQAPADNSWSPQL